MARSSVRHQQKNFEDEERKDEDDVAETFCGIVTKPVLQSAVVILRESMGRYGAERGNYFRHMGRSRCFYGIAYKKKIWVGWTGAQKCLSRDHLNAESKIEST